jgi:sulfatase maturation enzyme AslB (radical SAM superfamily)
MHIGIKNNGDLRMCSHSQSAGTGNTLLLKDNTVLTVSDLASPQVLNNDTLSQVRREMIEGKWPDQCMRCQADTASGNKSRNVWEAEKHQSAFTIDMALADTNEDGTINNPAIRSYDLRIGNTCNLRCSMCFPGESQKWYDIYQDVTGNDSFEVDDKIYKLANSKTAFSWSTNKINIDNLITNAAYITSIKLGGGEPLIIKHHKYILESLISAGYAKNIELEYSTNVTTFPPYLLNLWQHFKQIKICASVDAFGLANDAIRYPSSWTEVEANLRMLDDTPDNFYVFISSTVSLLSMEKYGELLAWIDSQQFKKIKQTASHLVYWPRWLSIVILDGDDFSKLIAPSLNDTKYDARLLAKIEQYNTLYNNVKVTDVNDLRTYRKQFVRSWDRLQHHQSQDWSTIFPVANEIVTKYRDIE